MKAREYGLDFFDTIFEMVDYEEMSMLAAYGGFPQRYPHWRFGAQFDELMKGYSYGLQKIYEMVINTDPCYAYLLTANEITDQKLVIAHVYGHCDFFKNNAWFSKTNRRMLDQMANHSARVNRYIDRFGYEPVEEFIDACLVDRRPHRSAFACSSKAKAEKPTAGKKEKQDKDGRSTVKSLRRAGFPSEKSYMDDFINPPDVLEAEAQRTRDQEGEGQSTKADRFPDQPERDVLLFLLGKRAAEGLAARCALDHPG